ncbi:DUF3187 family protein, partial [Acidobacteriota bacterium]
MVLIKMKNKPNKILLFLFLFSLCFNQYGADVEFPLTQSISFFPFFENDLLKKNGYSLSLDSYYSNIYMFDSRKTTVNDMEVFSNILAFRYGLFDSLSLEFYYRFSIIHGGSMDRFVMKFHETFNLPEAYRDEYPVNKVNYEFKNYYAYHERTGAPASLLFAVAPTLYRSEKAHILGRVGLGLPLLAKPGFTGKKPFLCAGVALVYKLGDFTIDFSGYFSFYKAPEWLKDEPIRYNIFTYETEVTFKRFFSGFRYRSSPFVDGDLSHRAAQLFIGYRFGKRFEFA